MAADAKYLNVNEADFEQVVLQSDVPVLVDFWAPWCQPCVALGPVIAKLAERFEGQAKVVKVDVDPNQRLAGEYGIQSIPAVLVFNDGEVVERMQGLLPEATIAAKLTPYVKDSSTA